MDTTRRYSGRPVVTPHRISASALCGKQASGTWQDVTVDFKSGGGDIGLSQGTKNQFVRNQ